MGRVFGRTSGGTPGETLLSGDLLLPKNGPIQTLLDRPPEGKTTSVLLPVRRSDLS